MLHLLATLRRLFESAPRRAATDEQFGDDKSDLDEPLPEVVRLEIRDSIDLHTFAPRDIPAIVSEYLLEARARGFTSVRIIHGKGTGTQRAVVRRLLAASELVADFDDAPPHSGGWGATVARLRPAPHDTRDGG